MNKIPLLEKFAVQSLVEHDGELIFSKEKFAKLIVEECISVPYDMWDRAEITGAYVAVKIEHRIKQHFGIE